MLLHGFQRRISVGGFLPSTEAAYFIEASVSFDRHLFSTLVLMVCIGFPHQSLRSSLINVLNGTKNACREARLLSLQTSAPLKCFFVTKKHPLQEGCCPCCRRCFLYIRYCCLTVQTEGYSPMLPVRMTNFTEFPESFSAPEKFV